MLKLSSKQVQNASANSSFRVKTIEGQYEQKLMSNEFNLPLVTSFKSSNQVKTQSQLKKLTGNPIFSVKLHNQLLLSENREPFDLKKYTKKSNTQENSIDILKSLKHPHNMEGDTEKIKIRPLSLYTHKEKYMDFKTTQQSKGIQIRKFQEKELTNDEEPLEIDQFIDIPQNIDKYKNLEKLQYKHEKINFAKQKKKLNFNFQSQLQRQSKIFMIKKLKRVFFSVFFVFALIKQFRNSNKNQFVKLKNILLQCQEQIKQYGPKHILHQRKQFVLFLASKIVYYIQTSDYQNLCGNLRNQLCVDFRKTNIINFSKQLYQNIELITRKQYFPKLFKSEMIINLFFNPERTTSYFVGKRCYFYSSSRTKIPKQQKQAISLEYLLFQVITPNLLNFAKDLELQNLNVRAEVLNNLLSIVSLMQKQFIKKFEYLPKMKISNANMVYRKFNLLQFDDDNIALEITENNQVGNENFIIEGLMDFQILLKLEREKPFWKIQMQQLFEKISENIDKLIEF